MGKFPVDVKREAVIKAFEALGFKLLRKGNHISMIRDNVDGSKTPLTLPNHPRMKGSTLRTVLTQAQISRAEFINAFEEE